jgi:radical SAM protein with 4Fe4S-binding SPASM domain
MNSQELKASLPYNLLVFADIASVSNTPTEAYKLLESVHKDKFADNERIVFYGNNPEPGLIKHINQARNLLDIGEFFCLFYTDIVDAEVHSTRYKIADTVCPLLWSHLEVRHNGDVYPCCVNKTPVGNANENSLQEIFNNDSMVLLRRQLATGGRPASCDHCWNLEKQGLSSNRMWHVGKNANSFYSSWHNDVKIRSLDLKPSNTCNFKCRTCNPNNSSLIADEVRRHSTIPIVSDRWEEYGDYTWAELDTLLPNIENLDFFGGEPFLLKELKQFLRSAVESKHSNHIRLHFNTNGSIFPKDIIDTLTQFKEVDIAFSIDDIGKRFELSRGGVWGDVEANILKFKELGFNPYIFPTVNVQNVFYLDKLIEWANSNGILCTFNYLEFPRWLNIDSMTESARDLVINKYKDSNNPTLQAIATRIAHSSGADGVNFVRQMKRLDSIRNQDFSSTHKEIAQAMGYNLISTTQL